MNSNIQKYKEFYFSIKEIKNEHFEEKICFDIQGWNHIIKQGNGSKREFSELKPRLEMLKFIPNLINKNISPQEYSKRIYSKNFEVEFYGFIFAIREESEEEFRIKIVVRQKTGQNKKFYSIIKMEHKHFQNKETP